MPLRLECVNNADRRTTALVFDREPVSAEDVLVAACNKFRLKPKRCRLFRGGVELQPTDALSSDPAASCSVWVVQEKEAYQGPREEQVKAQADALAAVTVLDGPDVWIDPEAVKQVHQTVLASAGGITRAVCLPDLHHGPTGVAILARSPMPKLPGYDIGCGMALFRTGIPATIARDKVARCMARLNLDAGEDPEDPHLGTIGGGNHFAELLVLDPAVPLSPEVQALLSPNHAVLLVHSGSRGHGSRVFNEHSDGHDPEAYMAQHIELIAWAKRNRAEIARRFLHQFAGGGGGSSRAAQQQQQQQQQQQPEAAQVSPAEAASGTGRAGDDTDDAVSVESGVGVWAEADAYGCPTAVVDIAHNFIQRLPDGSFLHRKGAAPSHPGDLSLLPGSRATASYMLVCRGCHERDLNSLAHGAGRRLSRADARRCGSGASSSGDLTRNGTVVCESKDLLLEEAPSAYKDVEAVVSCMVKRGMCAVGARMLPIATYKTRTPGPGCS